MPLYGSYSRITAQRAGTRTPRPRRLPALSRGACKVGVVRVHPAVTASLFVLVPILDLDTSARSVKNRVQPTNLYAGDGPTRASSSPAVAECDSRIRRRARRYGAFVRRRAPDGSRLRCSPGHAERSALAGRRPPRASDTRRLRSAGKRSSVPPGRQRPPMTTCTSCAAAGHGRRLTCRSDAGLGRCLSVSGSGVPDGQHPG